jgi:hypothetical protein
MKIATIGALAFLALATMGRPLVAQSAVTPKAERVEAQARAEAQEGVEAPEGVEGPEGAEAPEAPGDNGPDVDHQHEGEESGENGNGQGNGR